MNFPFSENSRVKIPALIHLTRLGYQYFSLKNSNLKSENANPSFIFDFETNIIKNIFKEQFLKINKEAGENEFENEFQNIILELGYDDLGKSFYNRLLGQGNSEYKLIDWENFNKNTFHICTELTCKNGEDEFRPDITIFVNGLPLSFIEVKKPNNHEGIKAERDRINYRFKNEKFRKFINIAQMLVFSNNMEYDDTGIDRLQGAFYATTAKNSAVKFNNFREEMKNELTELAEIEDETENEILKDNNLQTLKYSPEFITNKDEQTPTNSILTSLFSKNRLKMFLQFGIVYVNEENKDGSISLQKHIMRYPQFFATKAICKKIDEGAKKGVIWHTQGSGKTALAFYNVRYLTEYFSKKGIAPKFYFIVDRLDLLKQASKEFRKRGLAVSAVNSKNELIKDFKQNTTSNTITVINIQKFNEDTTAFNNSGYDINVQRVYFIDEAHRSYDPKGSSLANLYNSDKQSIKIALTGTPLILYKERKKDAENEEIFENKADLKTTKNIFGDYIHKYYYNNSIKDGYTLKLLREEIETSYKEKIRKVIKDAEVELGTLNKKDLYAHEKFVEPMLCYILDDFIQSRIRFGDKSIGAMVVCDSSQQARQMFKLFENSVYAPETNQSKTETSKYLTAAEPQTPYFLQRNLTAALILHNENDKEIRERQIDKFKTGKIDFLFVYSMLLTGFDASRLKKMYLGRKVKAHNLLQTLTRVNRPYKDFRMGYVVDFADIAQEFAATNKAYFDELNYEYDAEITGENQNDVFGSLFMSKEEIDFEMKNFTSVLSDFSTDNLEKFSQQITAIADREKILQVKKAIENVRDIYNLARLMGYTEALENMDIKLISRLLIETSNRLQLLNLQNAIKDVDSRQLLNEAIENVVFDFTKIGEEELKMFANDLQDTARQIRNALSDNWNQKDPQWISLYEEFRRLLDEHKIAENTFTREKADFISQELMQIYYQIRELNRRNSVLQDKFGGDRKFARVFKRLEISGEVSKNISLFDVLFGAKTAIDKKIYLNENLLGNGGYFRQLVGQNILTSFKNSQYKKQFNASVIQDLTRLTADEYLDEYQGNYQRF